MLLFRAKPAHIPDLGLGFQVYELFTVRFYEALQTSGASIIGDGVSFSHAFRIVNYHVKVSLLREI